MSAELIAALLAWASLLSGLPKPATPIHITFTPNAQLAVVACGHPCPVQGWTTPDNAVQIAQELAVAINDDASPHSVYARSVVVHELVHVLQQTTNGPTTSCAMAIARERAAYVAQRLYTERHGEVSRVSPALHTFRCSDVDKGATAHE